MGMHNSTRITIAECREKFGHGSLVDEMVAAALKSQGPVRDGPSVTFNADGQNYVVGLRETNINSCRKMRVGPFGTQSAGG